MVFELETDEFAIANNTAAAESARERIGWLLEGIAYDAWPYESAIIWHRRYTDLFTHLRGLAGQVFPPRPVDDDTLPPIMRRRGATAGLDDPELTDNSDFDPLARSNKQATLGHLLGLGSVAGSSVNPEPTDNSEPDPEDPAHFDWLSVLSVWQLVLLMLSLPTTLTSCLLLASTTLGMTFPNGGTIRTMIHRERNLLMKMTMRLWMNLDLDLVSTVKSV
jgi:hypothetical protein